MTSCFSYGRCSPERLLDKYMKQREKQDKVSLAAKESVYTSLPFKGDTQAEIISRRLSTTMCRTFYAANLRISFTSFPALQFHLKDKVLVLQLLFVYIHSHALVEHATLAARQDTCL